jgi:predicted TIM-barrel fold metal-dependent hydrolase
VIVDFHTHIFPPQVRDNRDEFLRRDPTFAEMYVFPKAKIATAEDLLREMDEAGVDVSVALGFAWRDREDCARHNDYLLEAAAGSGRRIVPFCTVNPADPEATAREAGRCAAGAPGLGELRPESQGWDLVGRAGETLSELASRHGLILLFHVTEEGGHEYPGKVGLPVDAFRRYLDRPGDSPIVGAHLAGGLPLEPGAALPARLYADTAALRFLYEPDVLPRAATALGGRLLFGSDFPLVSQAAALEDVRSAGLDEAALLGTLGGNADRLLGLS